MLFLWLFIAILIAKNLCSHWFSTGRFICIILTTLYVVFLYQQVYVMLNGPHYKVHMYGFLMYRYTNTWFSTSVLSDVVQERDTVCRILLSQELSGLIQGENLAAIQQMWLDGRMTNFEYLTHLNKMAGRSFNDLMQYPIFPFLLASYDTDSINLEDPAVYR